ncbi:MAG TPA: hypothetical protein VFW33_22050 [Gemmataceae bacterium]|nr:hypothetical protein [Gemmataceae bacterium]
MAWESRGGRRYYYRSVRVGRAVRRVYAGTGEVGRQAAAEDDRRRQARIAREETRREEAEYWDEVEAQLEEFVQFTEALARAALLAAGYFRHARGHWRRKRNMAKTLNAKPATPIQPAPDPEEVKEQEAEMKIQEWVRGAEQGDASVMPRLKVILDLAPSRWKRYGELGARVEALWLKMVAGENLMLLESWGRRLAEMRAELAGDSPTPLVRLLADRACATWLQLQAADAGAAMVQGGEAAEETTALRRQNSANKRYLQAMKTLAVVQRLLRPRVSPVQVASKLGAGGKAGVRQGAPISEGAGVMN